MMVIMCGRRGFFFFPFRKKPPKKPKNKALTGPFLYTISNDFFFKFIIIGAIILEEEKKKGNSERSLKANTIFSLRNFFDLLRQLKNKFWRWNDTLPPHKKKFHVFLANYEQNVILSFEIRNLETLRKKNKKYLSPSDKWVKIFHISTTITLIFITSSYKNKNKTFCFHLYLILKQTYNENYIYFLFFTNPG